MAEGWSPRSWLSSAICRPDGALEGRDKILRPVALANASKESAITENQRRFAINTKGDLPAPTEHA